MNKMTVFKKIKSNSKTLLIFLAGFFYILTFHFQNCSNFQSTKTSHSSSSQNGDNNSLSCKEPSTVWPRLTPYEYQNIINDLMQGQFNSTIISSLPSFPSLYGFDRISSPVFDRTTAQSYLNVAENVADQLLSNSQVLSFCDLKINFTQLNWNNCAKPLLFNIGSALFRRPLRESELSNLNSIFSTTKNLAIQRITSSDLTIQGYLDSVTLLSSNGVYATGWAYDPDWIERAVEVKFYISTDANSLGTYVGSTLSNKSRPDVNTVLGITGNHGFIFPIPKAYLNGSNFFISSLTVGTSMNKHLANSPKKFALTSSIEGPIQTGEMDDPFKDALRNSLITLLLSPHFLFKMEYFPDGFESHEEEYRKASLLSLIIGSTYPDKELTSLAQQNKLTKFELQNQARRLLNKYTKRFATSFGGFWIGYNSNLNKTPTSLDYSMGNEGLLVLEDIIQNDRPLSSILNPGFTYLNNSLGNYYSLTGSSNATQYVKVNSNDRGGMLNQAHFLIRTANVVQTNPIKRGVWVLDKVLCRSLPPLSIATLEEIKNAQKNIDPNATLVERMAAHRQYGSRCTACHSQIDPLGLGLEKWDMKGKFRSQYTNGQPVISNLKFEDLEVSDPTQLSEVLSQSTEYRNCVRAKLEAYVNAVDPTQPTKCGKQITSNVSFKELTIETILEAFKEYQ